MKPFLLLALVACDRPRWHHDDRNQPGGDGGPHTTPDITLDDLLAHLPDCEPASDDGRLDLDEGCADGACLGATFDAVSKALGDPKSCAGSDYQVVRCDWASGISIELDDVDMDGAPDAKATALSLTIVDPWDGGTDDGLGIGASLSCFVDAYGTPDAARFDADAVPYALDYEWLTVRADDDGLVDQLVVNDTP